MKYRITLVISTKSEYMLQVKTFLFWKNYTISSCSGYGTSFHTPTFFSIKEANKYAETQFGKLAEHVTTIFSGQ
jgi:23S rRNA maturation-related 3'-5' exoribonuclease YhaM